MLKQMLRKEEYVLITFTENPGLLRKGKGCFTEHGLGAAHRAVTG